MKSETHKSKIYCIKSNIFCGCNFIKDHIYNISYTSMITIYDDNKKEFQFHPTSPFNLSRKQDFFSNISEVRKEKLKKLNEFRL